MKKYLKVKVFNLYGGSTPNQPLTIEESAIDVAINIKLSFPYKTLEELRLMFRGVVGEMVSQWASQRQLIQSDNDFEVFDDNLWRKLEELTRDQYRQQAIKAAIYIKSMYPNKTLEELRGLLSGDSRPDGVSSSVATFMGIPGVDRELIQLIDKSVVASLFFFSFFWGKIKELIREQNMSFRESKNQLRHELLGDH
jgi:hypothetical protein